ncbi:MAG: AAA family ATPase [Chloroflexi bacterium]|nr:AAA family ATPase [Chloroflexota bacterium]
MYLQQVRLRDIRCFHDQTVTFGSDDTPYHWVVILGENGTGKSTLLQTIALSLLGRDLIHEIANEVDWNQFVRSTAEKGRIDTVIFTTKSDKKRYGIANGKYQNHYVTRFELGPTKKIGLEQKRDVAPKDYDKFDETLYSNKLDVGWFAAGYGVWRRLSTPKPPSRTGLSAVQSRKKSQRFVTMFNSEQALTDVADWLVALDFQRLKEPDNSALKKQFDLAIRTLEAVWNDVKFKEITSDGEIIFEEDGLSVSIDNLSDGYLSVAAWIGDLVRRLVQAFPQKSNPLHAEGIVLVDEIDIHLHPKWQRSIVETVRKLFPNLQFIVTSHSPFVAQDMQPNDKIIVLEKKEGEVIVLQDIDSVQGWRVDQILTSKLFDLESTRNTSITHAQKEYESLLDLRTTNKFEKKDQERLDELKQWLQTKRSLPGETIEENEIYDVTQKMLDLLDKHLK